MRKMQTAVACTRLLSRAFLNGIYNRNASASGLPTARNENGQNDKSSECETKSTRQRQPNEATENLLIKKPRLISGISGIPKNIGMRRLNPFQFGDDSCFVSQHSTGDVLGVADGVGGWRQYGVDPGTFSDALMRACERVVTAGAFRPHQPAQLLARAYDELMNSKEPIVGSSTACVVVLSRETGHLHAANIGDSGFLLVRDGRVLLRSEEQQHYFNTPYQLSNAPPGQDGQVLSDRPETARTSEMPVQTGDVIMLGTDGVFDNLPDAMLVHELSGLHGCADRDRLQAAANAIALMARRLAFDGTYMSPFAKNALTHGIDAVGGKPDDITVILATVIS